MSEKPQIKVSDVLNMLRDGNSREEIREHYGLNKADLKRLFLHPSLKGRRTRIKAGFNLIDDVTEDSSTEPASISDTVTDTISEETVMEEVVMEEEPQSNWEN